MTQSAETLKRGCRVARLDRERAAGLIAPAGGFDHRLDVHAVVDEVRQHLKVALDLAVVAWRPEDEAGAAILEDHRGVERVGGALAALEAVDVGRVGREAEGAVVEQDAGAGGHPAGAEAAEERLDPGDCVALAIDHRHVGRVAASPRRISGWKLRFSGPEIPREYARDDALREI